MEKELQTLKQKGIIHFLIVFFFFWDIMCNFQWLQGKFIFLLSNSNFKCNVQILFVIILHERIFCIWSKFYEWKTYLSFSDLIIVLQIGIILFFWYIFPKNFDISSTFLINRTAVKWIEYFIVYCRHKVIEICCKSKFKIILKTHRYILNYNFSF